MGHTRELTILTSMCSFDLRILRARERRGKSSQGGAKHRAAPCQGALRSPEVARTSGKAAPELARESPRARVRPLRGAMRGRRFADSSTEARAGWMSPKRSFEVSRASEGRRRLHIGFDDLSESFRPALRGGEVDREARRRARGSSANRGGWLKTLEAGKGQERLQLRFAAKT